MVSTGNIIVSYCKGGFYRNGKSECRKCLVKWGREPYIIEYLKPTIYMERCTQRKGWSSLSYNGGVVDKIRTF